MVKNSEEVRAFNPEEIPNLPGVYLFKDSDQHIIYVGKAKSLRDRVRSYFRRSQDDWKVRDLIREHASISYIVTHSETEALLLEVQLIQDLQPRYNTLLRSGNPFLYLLFTDRELKIVRLKKEKGTYFGPFLHKKDARGAYEYLVRTFKLIACNKDIPEGCLDYHLGRCPGSCRGELNDADLYVRLALARDAMRGDHEQFIERLQSEITQLSRAHEFEKAQHLAEYLKNLDVIFATIRTRYSEQRYAQEILRAALPEREGDKTVHSGLEEIRDLLELERIPQTIDCFDISHFQGTFIVGSCVRFTDGIPDKDKFRRFKIRSLKSHDDYAALREIVSRRYSGESGEDIPDLILIDGGKGQLSAVRGIVPRVPLMSLAKREERLFTSHHPEGIVLDYKTDHGKLLIALRDYTHHCAILYHKLLRKKGLKGYES